MRCKINCCKTVGKKCVALLLHVCLLPSVAVYSSTQSKQVAFLNSRRSVTLDLKCKCDRKIWNSVKIIRRKYRIIRNQRTVVGNMKCEKVSN